MLRRLVETRGARRAVGLILSNAQADWIRSWGNPQIEVRVESWSDHHPTARYDAIISIGVFEHFAKLEASNAEKVEGYRAFFALCRDWLKPQGRLSLQTFAYSSTGTILAIAANRLSYLLNLRGPSLAVDTACSSSLVTVHLACQSLRCRESDLALAGGVNLILSPEVTIILSQGGLMSARGRCHTFDENADGYVRSEGCGQHCWTTR